MAVLPYAEAPSERRGVGMRRAHQVIAVVFGVIGVALVVRGVVGGIWPVSLQLVAGILLLVLAVVRWIYA